MAGYRLLKAMSLDFPQMQQELSVHLPLFLSHITCSLEAPDISPTGCLATICHDNRVACLRVDDTIISRFIDIAASTQLPRYLRLLRMFIDPQGRPIHRNQEVVVRKLSENNLALLLFNDVSGREERRALVEARDHDLNPRGRINYHVQLLNLLAACCLGKSAIVELVVRDLVPLSEMMAHLLDANLTPELHASYLCLFSEAYLLTELFQKDVGVHPSMNSLLASMRMTIEAYAERRFVTKTLVEPDSALEDALIFHSLIPAVQYFYEEKHYREQCTVAVHAASKELIEALIKLLRQARGSGLPTHQLATCLPVVVNRVAAVTPPGPELRLPDDFTWLHEESMLNSAENAALRRTTALPSPQDALSSFTDAIAMLLGAEKEIDELVAVFKTGIDDEVSMGEKEAMPALGVQYCKQVINQLQKSRIGPGGRLGDEERRQTVAVLKVLTAVLHDPREGEEWDQVRYRRQSTLNNLGATHVALMMSTCLDDSLCEHGLQLGVALLQQGHPDVQHQVFRLLSENDDSIRPFDGSSGQFLAMMKYRLECAPLSTRSLLDAYHPLD